MVLFLCDLAYSSQEQQLFLMNLTPNRGLNLNVAYAFIHTSTTEAVKRCVIVIFEDLTHLRFTSKIRCLLKCTFIRQRLSRLAERRSEVER